MGINKAIEEYRDAKRAMESIVNRHIAEAFAEIVKEFGSAPTEITLRITTQQVLSEKYPSGVYCGCEVSVGGE